MVAAGVVLTGLAGTASWAVIGGRSGNAVSPAPTGVRTGLAPVVKADVAERNQLIGTLGHAGAYDVIASGAGTLTKLPEIGQVVARGQAAYEAKGALVVLMYGRRPVWRAFTSGMTDGPDVKQLEANLAALGYGSGLTVDKHFSSATYWAIRRWQYAAHLPVTGKVPLGQIVFVPEAVRISGHDVILVASVRAGCWVISTP